MEIKSHLPQPYKERIHRSPEFKEWVSIEIKSLVQIGVLKEWNQDTMGASTPVVIAPLLVEPSKPRLIYEAGYVNCFLDLPAVEMFGIGKIPSSSWNGMHVISMDHPEC